jgi:hypothetical protein
MNFYGLTGLRHSSRSNCHELMTIIQIQHLSLLPIARLRSSIDGDGNSTNSLCRYDRLPSR